MKKTNLVLFLLSGLLQLAAEEQLPSVRQADSAPFTPQGKLISAVWKKADILGRFSIPQKATVAVKQTDVRLLYDQTNLYISIRARQEPAWAKKQETGGLWKGNNFEIFLKENSADKRYYHIAVARKASVYFANAGMKQPGTKIKVFFQDLSRNIFAANIVIPLDCIGLSGKKLADLKLRFNVTRQNADVPGDKPVPSSYAVLDHMNYHNPDTWAEIKFSDQHSESRFCWHDNPGFRLNLLPNYNFAAQINQRPIGWNCRKDTACQEVMLYSGEYKLSAGGKTEMFLSGGYEAAPWLVAGRDYTLKIRARRQGGDGALGIVQLAMSREGKKKTNYITWNMPLSEEWHDYYLKTRLEEGFDDFLFYRKASDPASRVELCSIQLYEGKISSFEVRQITADSSRKPVPGTRTALPVNIYGKNKKHLRTLYIASFTSGMTNSAREIAEIVNGLNISVDTIGTSGKKSDVYYTASNPQKVISGIEKNQYDLYVIGNGPYGDSQPERIGKTLSEKIMTNVEKGAALVMMQTKKQVFFFELLKKYPPVAVAPEHYLRRSLPLSMFKRSPNTPDPLADISEAQCGKGRLLLLRSASKNCSLQILNQDDEYLASVFPYENYVNAWYARVFLYAAREKALPELTIGETADGGEASCLNDKNIAGSLAWKISSKDGSCAASGTVSFQNGKAVFPFSREKILSGHYLIETWLRDAEGNTLTYDNAVFEKVGPSLAEVRSVGDYYSGSEPAEIFLKQTGITPGMRTAWQLEDFSGRILEQGAFDAVPEKKFTIPLNSFYTTLANLDVRLIRDGAVLDRQRIPVIIQGCDRKRLYDDFYMQAWGYGPYSVSRFTSGEIEKQAEKIGILVYNFGDIAAALKAGKNVSMIGVGGISFRDSQHFQRNIRHYPLNTADARAKIVQASQTNGLKSRKYGYFCCGQVDEAELTFPSAKIEPDTTPENVDEYRKRMREKYGDIAAFNRACGSHYSRFEELKPCFAADARKNGNFGEYVEWRVFNTDRWIEAFQLSRDALRKTDPNAHYSLQNAYGQGVCTGNDYWKLYTQAGFDFSSDYGIYNSFGRTAPQRHNEELLRSFNPAVINRSFGGYSRSIDYAHYYPWRSALHRFAGYTHYCLDQSPWRLLHSAPDYSLTVYADECGKILRKSGLMDGLGKLMREYDWAKRDIAVYYHHNSMYTAFLLGKENVSLEHFPGSSLNRYYLGRQNLIYLLERLQHQYDFIASPQVENGILARYKVLFMPSVLSLSDKELAEIDKFIKNGGKVIADLPPNTHNELAMPRKDGGVPEAIVLGSMFNDRDDTQREQINRLLHSFRIAPVLEAENNIKGCEAFHFVNGDMHVFAALHDPFETEALSEHTFHFPVKGHLYDLRNGKYYGITDQVKYQIPHAEAGVWGIYPYQVKGIQVKHPSKVKRGTDLDLDIRILTSEGNAGKHIFHVEVIPPDKQVRFFMKRNLVASNGQTGFRYRIAFNDPAGTWQIKVKDILTGTVVVKDFTVTEQ